MDLVVIVEPSDGDYPGQMVVAQEAETGSRYFGFHMDAGLLPEEYSEPKRWQEYLYSNKILGESREESQYVKRIRREKASVITETRVSCDLPIETVIPSQATWKHPAYYSFRPDDFHSDAYPCYNCVTWATMIANKLVPSFITPVRQGRIKLMSGSSKGPPARKEKRMAKRIVKLSHDPFAVDLEKDGWYMVDSATGDVLYGCAVFHADRGLSFCLTPGPKGYHLKLQSPITTFEIGWTEDADAATWVDAVNRFLETKRGAATANGKPMPSAPAGSAVGK